MSLLGGLLGPLLTAGTQQAGTYENAEANASQLKRETIMQSAMLARQLELDRAKIALQGAQTTEAQRNAATLRLGDPTYNSTEAALEAGKANATLPFQEELAKYTGGITGANQLAVAKLEGQNALNVAGTNNAASAARQASENLFQSGELGRSLSAALANKIAGVQQQQKGSIMGALGRGLHILPQIPDNLGTTQPITPTVPTGGDLFGDLPKAAPINP